MKSERTASGPRNDARPGPGGGPGDRRGFGGGASDNRGPASGGRPSGPGGRAPAPAPARPFNNPFAGLDKLRGK